MKELFSVSPLKILEKTTRKELGKGNLGVLIARAGVGKTVCLIHLAFNHIFRRKKLVHVSLEEVPEKIASYYKVMYSELVTALDITDDYKYGDRIEKDRMILAYLNRSFDIERLRASLNNLKNELKFIPSALIIDGLDFENTGRELFEQIKDIALEFEVEIWLSALSHRHITEINERGIPYPCDRIDDLFTIIMQLQTGPSGVFLSLLKDHDNASIRDIRVRLDPGTFFSMA